MAYYSKKNKNHTTVPNLSNLARGSEISSYVKKEIFASQYDFHDMESLEVESVILNEKGKRGYVSGVLLNSGDIKQDVNKIHQEVNPVPEQLTFDSLEVLNYNLIKYLDACTHPVVDNVQDSLTKAKEIFKK